MRATRGLLAAAVLLVLCLPAAAAPQGQGAGAAPSAVAVAGQHLSDAEAFWADGKYDQCAGAVRQGITSAPAATFLQPSLARILARLHVLEALLAYTFRGDQYAQEVDAALEAALAMDPYVELGDPAVIPAFVTGRFSKLRDSYLRRFSRSARPNEVGGFAALVLEPTVITNPALLQPGFSYARNIGDTAAVEADFRFPLQWPPWNSIRGQLGLVLFPAFAIERVSTGVSLSYVFGLDELSTYTHSLSLGGRAEWISRGGLGFAASAELARIDLVLGTSNVTEPPRYTEIPFFGVVNVVFANVTLYAFFVF